MVLNYELIPLLFVPSAAMEEPFENYDIELLILFPFY
jgi:hypothetical protein